MARISHPNIVTVHDYGQTSMGTFYYAMELLDGLDLERLVQRHGPPPPERAVHVLRQTARALAHAHAQGLVSAQHLYELPKPLNERTKVSAELERVVHRCLEKSPARRFADANELERALGACPEACGWTFADAERWWKENEANPARATEPSSAVLDRIEVAGDRALRVLEAGAIR